MLAMLEFLFLGTLALLGLALVFLCITMALIFYWEVVAPRARVGERLGCFMAWWEKKCNGWGPQG